MKRRFSDYLIHDYNTRLLVNSHEVISQTGQQLEGLFLSQDFEPAIDEAAWEKISALIRAVHPSVLRMERLTAGKDRLLQICLNQQISPQLVFDRTITDAELSRSVRELLGMFAPDDLWRPQRFYEIEMSRDDFPADDSDEAAQPILNRLHDLAALIREIDAEGQIILPGIAPFGNDFGRSAAWNRRMMESSPDLLGIRWIYPDMSGWTFDEKSDGLECACAFADDFELMLRRLAAQVAETGSAGKRVKAALNWGFGKNSPMTRQDVFYYAGVCRRIRKQPGLVGLHCCGPLLDGGDMSLIALKSGNVWSSPAYEYFLLEKSAQKVTISVQPDAKKAPPVYNWPGIPGRVESRQISLLEASASRSLDGRTLFLNVQNRHPYRRAQVRVELLYCPPMRPLEAYLLRAKKNLDFNNVDHPRAVHYEPIKLRRYPKMDHVNLDIAPSGFAGMLLTSE